MTCWLIGIAAIEFDGIHQALHVISLWLVLGELVLRCLFALVVDYRIEERLGHIDVLLLYLSLDLLANCLQFLLQIKFIDHVRKVFNVIFIIHFGKLFKNDKLVYGRMNQITAGFFELFELCLCLSYFVHENFHGLICRW